MSDIEQLKSENLQQSEEIRRLREAIKKAKSYVDEHFCRPDSDISGCKQCDVGWELGGALTPTPSNWGTKALAVVEAAVEWVTGEDCACDWYDSQTCSLCIEREKRTYKAVSELQKERTN